MAKPIVNKTPATPERERPTLLDVVDTVTLAKENVGCVRSFVSGIIANLPVDSDDAPLHEVIAMDCILERVEKLLQKAADITTRFNLAEAAPAVV